MTRRISRFRKSAWRRLSLILLGGALASLGAWLPAFAGTPKPTTPPTLTPPVDPGRTALNALNAGANLTTALGADVNGLDTNKPVLNFNIQGTPVIFLTKVGLGVNMPQSGNVDTDPNDNPNEALDVNGYLRLRSANGYGGGLALDGVSGISVWMNNLLGMFTVINSDWSSMLFEVEQGGNIASLGDIYNYNNVIQNSNALRLLGGCYESAWRNSGSALTLTINPANKTACAAYPNSGTDLSIDNASGAVTFPQGFSLSGASALTFQDNTQQTSASEYGGSYSWSSVGPGTPTCTPNYKTNGCSCPTGASLPITTIKLTLADGSCLTAVSCVGFRKASSGLVWSEILAPGAPTPSCSPTSPYMPVLWTTTSVLNGVATKYTYNPQTGLTTAGN